MEKGYVDGSLNVSYSKYASDIMGLDLWVVTEGFTYHLSENTFIYVPKGYLTDGASVPRLLENIIPAWGDHGLAAVIHDYLCEYLQIWQNGERKTITREQCNDIFYQCMRDCNVNRFKAISMYVAVKAYSHVLSIIYYSYDPKKHDIEKHLVEHHNQHGTWL